MQYPHSCAPSLTFSPVWTRLQSAVYAMFNHHRVLVVALIILFITYIAASATVLAISYSHVEFMPQCIITSIPEIVSLVW